MAKNDRNLTQNRLFRNFQLSPRIRPLAPLSTMQNLSKSGDESVCQAQFFKTSFMDAFGNLFFAFLCHDCIMSIYSELRATGKSGNQGEKFMRVCRYAFAGITTLYMLCGLFGYFTWYDSTISEILLAYSHGYSDNIFIFAARLFVLVTVTFSVPIVHYACRKAFCMLVYGEYRALRNEINKNDQKCIKVAKNYQKDQKGQKKAQNGLKTTKNGHFHPFSTIFTYFHQLLLFPSVFPPTSYTPPHPTTNPEFTFSNMVSQLFTWA